MDIVNIGLQIILCIFIADFLTGLFHWLEDTYGTKTTPFIAESIILPNIDHHRNPSALAENGNFFTRTRTSFYVSIPFLLMFYWHNMLTWQVGLTAFLTCLGNEFHAITHGAYKGNKVLAFLKKQRIIQTPKHHAKHHVPPFDRDFCVLTNFVNPVLEKIKFWRILELFIGVIFGVSPKRMTAERDYL